MSRRRWLNAERHFVDHSSNRLEWLKASAHAHSLSTRRPAVFHSSMLRNDFIQRWIRLPVNRERSYKFHGNDLVAASGFMSEMDIDLERVISDPTYRRSVMAYLKAEAESGAAPADAHPADGRRGAGEPASDAAPAR